MFHSNVETAAIAELHDQVRNKSSSWKVITPAQNTCALHPFLRFFSDMTVASHGPFMLVWSSRTPDIRDRITRFMEFSRHSCPAGHAFAELNLEERSSVIVKRQLVTHAAVIDGSGVMDIR